VLADSKGKMVKVL